MDTKSRIEELLAEVKQRAANAPPITCPVFLCDDRLEDAWKAPECDEEGYSESIPAIYNDYSYGKDDNGIMILSLKSATLETRLYSKYLDEEALVWDSLKERLLLYVPNPKEPRIAFKGSRWLFAKRLKQEYKDLITLRDVYYEIMEEKQQDTSWLNEQKQ